MFQKHVIADGRKVTYNLEPRTIDSKLFIEVVGKIALLNVNDLYFLSLIIVTFTK